MKKTHLFLLALSALSLMACGGNTTSSSAAATSSTPASSVTSSVATSSQAASSVTSSKETSSEAAPSSQAESSVEASSEVESSVEESSEEAQAYTATFSHDDTVSIYVYPASDYTATPTLSDTAIAVDGDTGATVSDGTGQINFKVELAEGYTIDAMNVDGSFKNLKGPEDTGAENVYRITKISSDLTVTITTRLTTDVATGYQVTFNPDEHVQVYVYDTQDVSGEGTLSNTAYSRDGDTGELLKDGNGQVNFKLVVDDGYTPNITIAESTYKNLKGPDDTGVENCYRITKITGDLTVTITSTANA